MGTRPAPLGPAAAQRSTGRDAGDGDRVIGLGRLGKGVRMTGPAHEDQSCVARAWVTGNRLGRQGLDMDKGTRSPGPAAGALNRSAAHLPAPTPSACVDLRFKYPAKNSLRGLLPITDARSSNLANGRGLAGEARSRQAGPR